MSSLFHIFLNLSERYQVNILYRPTFEVITLKSHNNRIQLYNYLCQSIHFLVWKRPDLKGLHCLAGCCWCWHYCSSHGDECSPHLCCCRSEHASGCWHCSRRVPLMPTRLCRWWPPPNAIQWCLVCWQAGHNNEWT